MHPAYSVIVFTTASGAGYGLLVWMALSGLAGLVPLERPLGLAGFAAALGLVTAGLLSSTFHLGRPERAWRALSQWRTSWLSREAFAALLTFVPALLLAYGWLDRGMLPLSAALATVLGALATVWCTGMIYQCLTTIRAWRQPWTSPVYAALSLATGGVLLVAIVTAFGHRAGLLPWLAIAPLAAAWLLKARAWAAIDAAPAGPDTADATGLGRPAAGARAVVRQLDPPHSQANYVMREMGYAIARRHAERLREIAAVALFALPLALQLVVLGKQMGMIALLAALAAVASATLGVLVERWLFFAEATHIVTLYYGRDAA